MPSSLEFANQLKSKFPDLVTEPVEFRGEISVCIRDSGRVLEIMNFLRDALNFDMLMDISSVDHMGEEPRYEVVYHIFSLQTRAELRLKTKVGEENSELPSIAAVWPAADWHEREVFDMMGIKFSGHPDLRRILMWDSYPYYPLRKDFPLAGKPTGDGIVKPAPLAGGPFVTSPGDKITIDREPRAKGETDSKGKQLI
jgi:NADH-quinone oxidoreductase subunit C